MEIEAGYAPVVVSCRTAAALGSYRVYWSRVRED